MLISAPEDASDPISYGLLPPVNTLKEKRGPYCVKKKGFVKAILAILNINIYFIKKVNSVSNLKKYIF